MRDVLWSSVLFLAACVSPAPSESAPERVDQVGVAQPPGDPPQVGNAMPPPLRVLQGPGELQVRGYLQDVISDRFGAEAWRAFLASRTAIAVASLPGRWATSHQPRVNLLIRSGNGWTGRHSGAPAAVPAQAGTELDRLLAGRQLWAEPSQYPEYFCPDSGADVIMIRHAGRTKTVYQSGGCGTPNLSTRLISTALQERLPQ